ncbi:M20/M25/M40 family metallo-hydrolase [Olivibacter sp. XZL3]|uniref:M20/M25/M40 family metallo-hydrolase n=1 Tax=Olivibacter sp. XZL3 TaxID=1735116 RepID=UPI001066CF95|nr:M20/M25/M40 family metallo-hydrolase [Olivibacter sp. XZL3]
MFTIPTFFKSLLTGVLLFVAGYCHAQDSDVKPDSLIIRRHVDFLAATNLAGRGTGSKGLKKAAKYIERHFKAYGLTPMGGKGYKQPFIAKVVRVPVPDSLRKAYNLIAYLDNKAAHTVVVGAHYDHLGLGRQGGSKDPSPEGKIHHGADDNASGVAGLLELARCFSQNDLQENYNILFIAFSGEELGLLGSKHYVEHPVIPLNELSFMVNMDMIGRYDPSRGVGIGGFGTSDNWPTIFEGITSDIQYFTDRSGSGGSDHGSFYAKGIPVLFFHTGGHADYHMPTDTAEKVDVKAEAAIVDLEMRIILKAMKENKLNFTEVK